MRFVVRPDVLLNPEYRRSTIGMERPYPLIVFTRSNVARRQTRNQMKIVTSTTDGETDENRDHNAMPYPRRSDFGESRRMGGIVYTGYIGCRSIPITVFNTWCDARQNASDPSFTPPPRYAPASVRSVEYRIESFFTSIYWCSTYGRRQRQHVALLQYCTGLYGNLNLTLIASNLSSQRDCSLKRAS